MLLFIKLIIIIIFYTVISPSCVSLDKVSNSNKFDIITRSVVSVLSTCIHHKNRDFVTVLIDSKERIRLPGQLFNTFSVLETKSFISNDNVTIIPSNIFGTTDKLELVLAIVSSTSTLQHFLTNLKRSKSWNIYALYLIIDAETLEKNCERANDFLRTLWMNNLLMGNFFCMNSNEEIFIYTYNPYINWAPKEWQEVSVRSNEQTSYDSWTLFKRKLINDRTTCSELYFRKDITIGGHEIKAIAMSVPPTLVVHRNKTGWDKYEGLDALLAKALTTKLNATLQVTVVDDVARNYGSSESNKIQNLTIIDIIRSRQRDILMNAQYFFNKPTNTTFTYPHTNSGVSVMTRNAGFETGPSKILHFMNPKLILGICLVFVVTVPIVSFLGGEDIISASLEVLRIVIGVSVVRTPKRTPLRLYLITVILLFLITGSTFQSSLSSILTSPVALRNIDDIIDLRKSTHTIYVFHGYKNVIIDDDLEPRTILTNHWNCSRYVMEQKNTVCAAERSRLAKIGFEHKLYVSKHRLTTLYSVFIVRPDWPLIRRFSTLLQYMWQCGLIDHWFDKTVWSYKPQWLMKHRVIESTDYRSMTVADLDFAFYILLFGLTASILVFIIERLTWKNCPGVPRKRKVNLPPLFEYTE